MDAKELGAQVLARRKEKGFSQTELAERTGISRNYVSLIERGEATNISMRIINQLAVNLETTSSDLFGASKRVTIPTSLGEFAKEQDLPYSVTEKLAAIPRRGKEPTTPAEWSNLYNAIKPYLDGENDK
jgi:transcriptional regulator with XRE-family HTH domain